jgi:hypothetical protein
MYNCTQLPWKHSRELSRGRVTKSLLSGANAGAPAVRTRFPRRSRSLWPLSFTVLPSFDRHAMARLFGSNSATFYVPLATSIISSIVLSGPLGYLTQFFPVLPALFPAMRPNTEPAIRPVPPG